jgi:hypothetical protein
LWYGDYPCKFTPPKGSDNEVTNYLPNSIGSDLSIEMIDDPAFVVIDDKGNGLFKELNLG